VVRPEGEGVLAGDRVVVAEAGVEPGGLGGRATAAMAGAEPNSAASSTS
jgi:hypothetical protein